MGVLIDGVWQEQEPEAAKADPAGASGRYERAQTAFRNWVTPDGRPGPTGSDGFSAAPSRYHLYVSLACPWAHRTLIVRALKGLEQIIPVSVTHWLMAEQGWTFSPGEGVIPIRCSTADTCTKSTRGRTRITPAAPACRCYGTSTLRPSSTTNRLRSSACSTAHLMRWERGRRLLPQGAARGNRCAERAYLRYRQQRCLQGRLRDHTGGL